MSKATLSSENFGDKIYNKFPNIYRVRDEEDAKSALYKYISSISDGGFKYVIDDINRLLTLYDAEKLSMDIAPLIFKSFGFDVFNGIPESYVRNLLPAIGELFEHKGSVVAVEYITSVVTNVKTTIEIIDAEEAEEQGIIITLELSYGASDADLPSEDQLRRIINEFLPFYCFVIVVFAFIYTEDERVRVLDTYLLDVVRDAKTDSATDVYGTDSYIRNKLFFTVDESGAIVPNTVSTTGAIFGEALFGTAVFGNGTEGTIYVDDYSDEITFVYRAVCGVTVTDTPLDNITVVPLSDSVTLNLSDAEECGKLLEKIEVETLNYSGLLPEGSAFLGTGQPLGNMVLGRALPYTEADYYEDNIVYV